MKQIEINKDFICAVVDALNEVVKAHEQKHTKYELHDKDSGFRFMLYELSRNYWRLDIFNKKGVDLLDIVLIEKEVEEDDSKKQD